MSDDPKLDLDLGAVDRSIHQLRDAAARYIEACQALSTALRTIPEDAQCMPLRVSFTGLDKVVRLSGELLLVMGKDIADRLDHIASHLNESHDPVVDDGDSDVPDSVVH
jgi:hypothetical protein